MSIFYLLKHRYYRIFFKEVFYYLHSFFISLISNKGYFIKKYNDKNCKKTLVYYYCSLCKNCSYNSQLELNYDKKHSYKNNSNSAYTFSGKYRKLFYLSLKYKKCKQDKNTIIGGNFRYLSTLQFNKHYYECNDIIYLKDNNCIFIKKLQYEDKYDNDDNTSLSKEEVIQYHHELKIKCYCIIDKRYFINNYINYDKKLDKFIYHWFKFNHKLRLNCINRFILKHIFKVKLLNLKDKR